MEWNEVRVWGVTVNLPEGKVSINDGAIVLTAVHGKVRMMQLAYAVAHATVHSPVHRSFKGLTWAWFKAGLKDSTSWKALCQGNTARTVWNQNCLAPASWCISGREVPSGDWFETGGDFLASLFLSEPLTESQKYYVDSKRCVHRIHLPDNVLVVVEPDMPSVANVCIPDVPTASAAGNGVLRHMVAEDVDRRHFRESLGNGPLSPDLFVGRENDMHQLKVRLGIGGRKRARQSQRVVVYGLPGVGKSTIAAALANDTDVLDDFVDGVLWVSLGQDPRLIRELTNWCGVLGQLSVVKVEGVDKASELLRTSLRGRRILLIIDDIWDVAHAAAFNVGYSECGVVMTTRLPSVARALAIHTDDVYQLGRLDEAASFDLFEELAPTVVRECPDECRELVQELEGLPLSLRVVAKMLSFEASHDWGVEELLRELREDAAKILDSEVPSDMTSLMDGTTPKVAMLLRKSTDRLEGRVLACFIKLGAFAPKPATFDLSAMAYVWGLKDPKSVVRELVGRGLLDPMGHQRFQMHAILVAHAKMLKKSLVG